MVDREFPLDLLHALGDVGIEEHITPMPVGSALEREMHSALKRTHRRARRTWRRRRLGWVVPVLSVAVAAAVAVLAITLLSHHSHDVQQRPAAPESVSERFAVLRRAQTVQDRLPLSLQRQVAAQYGGRVLPRLTRLIATRGTARVFLVVLVPGQLGSAVALRHCNGALGSAIKSRW